MLTKVSLLGVGNSPIHDIDPYLVEHWMTAEFVPLMNPPDYVETMNSLVRDNYRCEGYLYHAGNIAGFCFYYPAIDPHYNQVAMPLVDYIRPWYRNNKAVLREFLDLRRNVVGRLGASQYITVKHVSGTLQHQRLRKL